MPGYRAIFDFNITTIDDSVVEETESFTFTIASSQPLNIPTLDGFVTVLDDDGEMYRYVGHKLQSIFTQVMYARKSASLLYKQSSNEYILYIYTMIHCCQNLMINESLGNWPDSIWSVRFNEVQSV